MLTGPQPDDLCQVCDLRDGESVERQDHAGRDHPFEHWLFGEEQEAG